MMNMQKIAITIKRALLIFAIIIFAVTCIAGCGADANTSDKTEGMAESSFRRQMSNDKVTQVTVKKDLVLEAPVEVNGTKVLCGEGSITATGDDWAGDAYMILVQPGAQLTVKGSVSINAGGIAGGIHVAKDAVWSMEETASVSCGSAKTANALVEGKFLMNGGTLSGAMGHNVYNMGEVTISAGEIIGSGEKYAGIYSEGTLTQSGGTVRDAYNNVAVLSGNFSFSGGNNQNSVRDGIYVGEGAKLAVTAKDAAVTGSGVRGIYLCGEATIDGITLQSSGDSLMKISKSGTLSFNGGALSDSGYHSIENAGKMVMTGGSVRNSYNCGIVNTGELEITGGSFLDNVNNKAVLNKHDGKATVSGEAVMFSGNRFALANEDTATLDLSGAGVLLTTGTNIYAYDGTVNIHDISLGASGSNNVRIYKAEVTMTNVQVLGNSASGSATTHGILLEGGVLNATDVSVTNVTGYGIRNKGGHITAENLLISKSIKAGGINNTVQDHTGLPGVAEIKNLTVEDIRYNNIVVEGGTLTVTNGQFKASGTNNTKITDGTLNLNNVEIHGNLPDTDGTNHAVYVTGGTIVAENVKIKDAKVTGLRVDGEKAVIKGKNVTIESSPKYGIDLTRGSINIDNLTMVGNHYNIENKGGSIKLRNSIMGATVSNNVRLKEGTIDLSNVLIKGHTKDHPDNVHALFVDDGKLTGENITVQNVANVGLRVKGGTADVRNFTVEDAGADGVWIDGGKAKICGLTVKKAEAAGISATNTADITVIGGSISNTVSHGAKSEGEARLTLEDISVAIATTDGRHAVLAQGGDIQLNQVKITGLENNTTGFGIRINRENSHVSGKDIHISDVNAGISAVAGTADISGLTTENIAVHSVYAASTANLVISDSVFGVTGTNNAKAENGGKLTLNKTVIEGTSENHGIMVEKGGHFVGNGLTVRNTAGSAVRVKCSSEGNDVEIDGLITENVGDQNVYINKDEDADNCGSVIIKNADLCRTDTHSVLAEAGNLTLVNTKLQGHLEGVENKLHAIYVTNKVEKVNLEGVTVLGAAGDALRISAGDVVATGFTSKQTGRYSIWADGGKLTVNGFADGSKSQIGTSKDDNIKATGTGVICLNDVAVAASGKNNVVAISGGTIRMSNATVTGGGHSVLADENGKVYLSNVTICDSVTSGIRANKKDSVLEATDVTIDGAKTGLSVKCGTVEITDITIRNTTEVGVSIAQAEHAANVTLNNLVTENCGGNAIYTSGADAKLTLNGATLSNNGANHMIYLNGGPMALNDVTINGDNLAAGKHELYSGAGWLTIGGEMDADIYIATNPGRVIKVNKELTGNKLVLDWKNIPTGNALEFANAGMMDASGDNIVLAQPNKMLHYYVKDTQAVAILVSDTVTSEAQLNNYLEYVQAQNMTEVTVRIGGSFTVAKQLSIPASVTNLTILDDGNGATDNTVTYSGSTDGLFVMRSDLKLTVQDVSLSSTNKVLLKQSSGTTELKQVTLSGKTTNIYVTGGKVTVDGAKIGVSTADNVKAENAGVIELNNVEILESAKNNVVAINGGTIRMSNATVTGGGHSVLADKNGKVYLNNVTIRDSVSSGIRANHKGSVVEATDVTIDGAKTGLSFKYGTVQIENITIRNTTGVGVDVREVAPPDVANVTLTNLIAENCGGNAIYTSGANARLTVNGATLSNNGSDHVIYLNGGPMALNDVTINGDNLAAGKHELYSGAGWLTIGGEMDADIYIATDPGRVIKVNKELTGNKLVLDWENEPDGNALEFTDAAMMDASKDNIVLGSVQGADKELVYEGVAATLKVPEVYTTVNSWSELNTYVSAMASGSYTNYRIGGNPSDWMVATPLTIPKGVQVKLSADENSPAIVVAAGVSPFTFEGNTALTLEKLVLGGTAEAKAAHIIVPKDAILTLDNTQLQYFESERGGAIHVNCGTLNATGATFTHNSNPTNWGGAIGIWGGTVQISDSQFTNNTSKSSGGAIINYKADGSSFGGTTDDTMGNLTLTNCVFTNNSTQEHGGAVAAWANGVTTITGCVFGDEADENKGNSVTKNGGAVHVQDGHAMTVTSCKFFSNSAAGEGGAIYTKSSAEMNVTDSTFKDSVATGNGGAILLLGSAQIRDSVFTGNSGKEGGAISLATGFSLTLHNIVCENNTTTRTNDLSTYGYGDIRVADNTAKGIVTISGKIVATIWNNQAHSIKIAGALTEGSNAIIDWRLGKLSANKVGIVFDSEEIMNASKAFIQLGTDASTTEGWELQYSEESPWKATLVKE